MVFASRREKRLWFAAGLCTLLIYSSLYIARPAAELLRERNLLRLAVALSFLAAGSLVAWRLFAIRAGWRALVTAGVIGAGYLALLTAIPMMPEERLHFLEYGVVAALIYLALCERRARLVETGIDVGDRVARLQPFATAVVSTGIIGWLDEGIQAILPNRVYDVRDVTFNAVAALISVASVKLMEWARQRE